MGNFDTSRDRVDGLSGWCKTCKALWYKAYSEENKERLTVKSKQYRLENMEKEALRAKAYYRKNKDAISANGKAYYVANRKEILARHKAHRESEGVREKHKVYMQAWNQENRQLRLDWNKNNRQYLRHYYQKRLRNDPAYKVRIRLAIRLNKWLTRRGTVKAATTMELAGCSINELMLHLQNQFREGMSWNNYGPVWHVDHIRPCASFNLADPEQQKLCFHYTNLQPLFGQENLKKGKKYVESNINL